LNRLDYIKERIEGFEEEGEDEQDTELQEESGLELCDLPVDDSYCRGIKDVVISGPLSTHTGHGRRFMTPVEALHWAQDKYGFDRVSLVTQPEGAPRWAVLIKNLRS
jgi:hypothetical protein